MLLQAGADVNAAGERGLTALMMAGQNRHPDVIDVLLKAGAKKHL